MFCKRGLSALVLFLILSQSANAQFNKWINKAKEKALEKVTGKKADTTAAAPKTEDTPASAVVPGQQADQPAPRAKPEKYTPQPIVFKHTGISVTAIHATLAPVIDGDIDRIAATPQGKFFFEEARQKGLKGTNAEIFRQMIDPKNSQLEKDIEQAAKEKFPSDAASGLTAPKGQNPAWGGISAPSLYFEVMMGSFDIWITGRYVKTTMKHDHVTVADGFGIQAASITDLDKHLVYAIGSVLGVNFTKVDTIHNIYRTLSLVKEEYLGIPGIKIEKGTVGEFGDYNTVSERIIIPVQPYHEKESGHLSNGLLYMHDILSNRQDIGAGEGQGHYDPSYRLIFEYYFTHDLDKYLPDNIKTIYSGALGTEGQCVGAAMKDENGNSAVWRLIDIQTGQNIDQGEFQTPADYPIMTHEQLHQAIRDKMGLKGK